MQTNKYIQTNKYPAPQMFLHWLILIAVIVTYVAIYQHDYNLHKLGGFTVLLLSLVRLVMLRVYKKRRPDIIPKLTTLEKVLATLVKIALALGFVLLPLAGIMMGLFKGYPFSFYGITIIPAGVVSANPELGAMAKNAHIFLANALYFVIGLHALAAIFHKYVKRDNTLDRMLPWGK